MGNEPTLSCLKECDSFLLVSVIIPVYNVAPYLNEALDSVVNQSYNNLEILIIDDGSKDNSGQICDEYSKKDERIRVIHQENKGLSAARNVGLDLMTGDVVVFLDADDAYDPNYVKLLIEALNQEKADCVVCRFTVHRTTKKMVVTGREKMNPQIGVGSYDKVSSLNAIIDGRINISTWNKMYRRELWNAIRFPDGHVFEEQKTILEIFDHCNKVYIIDRPLYLYRKRPGSISDTVSVSNMSDYISAYSYVEYFVKKHTPEVFLQNQVEKVRRETIEKFLSVYLISYKQTGNEWTDFCEKLRKQIIEKEKEVNGLRLRTKAEMGMICYTPWIIPLIDLIYHSVRSMFVIVFKRRGH